MRFLSGYSNQSLLADTTMIPSNPIQSDMTRPITTDRYCSRRAWSQEISILITIAAHYPGRVLVILRVVIVEMREKGRIYSYVTAIFTEKKKEKKRKINTPGIRNFRHASLNNSLFLYSYSNTLLNISSVPLSLLRTLMITPWSHPHD